MTTSYITVVGWLDDNSGSLGTSGINKNALAFASERLNRGYEIMSAEN